MLRLVLCRIFETLLRNLLVRTYASVGVSRSNNEAFRLTSMLEESFGVSSVWTSNRICDISASYDISVSVVIINLISEGRWFDPPDPYVTVPTSCRDQLVGTTT